MKKRSLKPDAWVISWSDVGDEYTKDKSCADRATACGPPVRALYYGWGAAACCPMVCR
jgi:hypothetical protein